MDKTLEQPHKPDNKKNEGSTELRHGMAEGQTLLICFSEPYYLETIERFTPRRARILCPSSGMHFNIIFKGSLLKEILVARNEHCVMNIIY